MKNLTLEEDMNNVSEFRKIYRSVLDTLDEYPASRKALIDRAQRDLGLTEAEISDKRTNGRANILRSMAGTVINEMCNKGIISKGDDGLYSKRTEKPVAIRIERCEEEILRLLREGEKTRSELKDSLVRFFGTDETATVKDDNKLFTYFGQILKRLTAEGVLDFNGSIYKIKPQRAVTARSREQMLALMGDFLTLLHSRGGEFFEHYFMNLLAKYYELEGKCVLESYATGGSEDGGIDGIAKTVDSLGFKETVMVQTKNRTDPSSETEVRSFYGAVCAAQGSRGIFATTSDLHPMAKKFLDSIDNCVGVNGERIFSMACKTLYGIKKCSGKLIIDTDII